MALKIRYLGWTAVELVTKQGKRILLDPMIAGSPDQGISRSPVPIEDLYDADLVLITHTAGDHVGQAFQIIQNSKALLVCDSATRFRAVEEAGISNDRIYYMVSGVRYVLETVSIKALPAIHLSVAKTPKGFIVGQPLSYLIETQDGERVFFGGDTSIHSDLKLFGELYRPHVAMLGVGGVKVHGQSLTELHPDEAALVAKWLGVEAAIPMHYRFDEGEVFAAELKKQAPGCRGIILKPGESYTYHLK